MPSHKRRAARRKAKQQALSLSLEAQPQTLPDHEPFETKSNLSAYEPPEMPDTEESICADQPKQLDFFCVGMSGQAGSGKDFVCLKLLVPMLTHGRPYIVGSFADVFKLKGIVENDLDPSKVYGRKDEFTRRTLQTMGTEGGRDVHGKDYWIRLLDERFKQYQQRGIQFFFITDCRFPNEVEYIKSRGGLVLRIEAEDRHRAAMIAEGNPSLGQHSSETALSSGVSWDFVLDNSLSQQPFVATRVREICKQIRETWKYPETVFFCLDGYLKENYFHHMEFQERVLQLLVKAQVMSQTDFVEALRRYQNTQIPVCMEGLAGYFVGLLGDKHCHLAPYIWQLATDVQTTYSPGLQDELSSYVKRTQAETHLVIVVVGEAIDQYGKLYQLGLLSVTVECVPPSVYEALNECPGTYLMDKYPSHSFSVTSRIEQTSTLYK